MLLPAVLRVSQPLTLTRTATPPGLPAQQADGVGSAEGKDSAEQEARVDRQAVG